MATMTHSVLENKIRGAEERWGLRVSPRLSLDQRFTKIVQIATTRMGMKRLKKEDIAAIKNLLRLRFIREAEQPIVAKSTILYKSTRVVSPYHSILMRVISWLGCTRMRGSVNKTSF